jgi:hypothetical protein
MTLTTVDIYYWPWILMSYGLEATLWSNNEQNINTFGILWILIMLFMLTLEP